MDLSNHYRTLGVPAGASQRAIAQAYRRLARQVHPDLHPPERKAWAEDQMKRLNEAYEALNDPQARTRYDIAYWQQKAAEHRRRREGPDEWRRFVAQAKRTFEALAVAFLVLGAFFYFLDWEAIFSLTPAHMVGLRCLFADLWVLLFGVMFLRMIPRRR